VLGGWKSDKLLNEGQRVIDESRGKRGCCMTSENWGEGGKGKEMVCLKKKRKKLSGRGVEGEGNEESLFLGENRKLGQAYCRGRGKGTMKKNYLGVEEGSEKRRSPLSEGLWRNGIYAKKGERRRVSLRKRVCRRKILCWVCGGRRRKTGAQVGENRCGSGTLNWVGPSRGE